MPEQMFDTKYLSEESLARDAAFPRFYIREVIDKKATRESGETVWTQQEFVEILIAGDPKLVVNRKVKDRDKKRWEKQYRDFKAGIEQTPEGFPLTAYPAIPPGVVKNLQAMNCWTVEQFVEMPDSALPPLPDIYRLREKAREFLDSKTDASKLNKLQMQAEDQRKDLEQKEGTIKELQEQMRILQAQIQAQNAAATPVTGNTEKRPRKRGKIKDE